MSENVVYPDFPAKPGVSQEPVPSPLVAKGGNGPHDPGMEARVAVLEQIAKDTREALIGIRSDTKEVRDEIRSLRTETRADYRWLLGLMVGTYALIATATAGVLGAMAKGFHWF